MFALHDRVRRRICIAGFILLCLVPTALVVGWAVAWRLPSHVRGEARRIGHQMGFDVSLGSVASMCRELALLARPFKPDGSPIACVAAFGHLHWRAHWP